MKERTDLSNLQFYILLFMLLYITYFIIIMINDNLAYKIESIVLPPMIHTLGS